MTVPLRSVLPYEDFITKNSSTLALPSDQKMRARGTEKEQRVKDQVMHTVRRKSSRGLSSSGYSSRGSGTDSASDYSTTTFRKVTTLSGASSKSYPSWGMQYNSQLSNGTIKYDKDNSRRFSSYSQMDNWMQQQHNSSVVGSPTSPSSDSAFLYSSRINSYSEPDLTNPQGRSIKYTKKKSSQISNGRAVGCPASGNSYMQGTFRNTIYQAAPQKRMSLHSPGIQSDGAGYSQFTTEQKRYSKRNFVDMDAGVSSGDRAGEIMEELTIQKAIDLLESKNPEMQVKACSFIQHATFQDDRAKQEVYRCDGIPQLVRLLRSNFPEIQEVAMGALRNSVFKNADNKREIQKCNGIKEALNILGDKSSPELQKQITGFMWNLSSHDELKDELINKALPTLTNEVVIPYSRWSEDNKVSRNAIDPEVFFNTTGCLRNLSSAEQSGRQTIRNCRGLIDSLAYYVQSCVNANIPDEKSIENCVCVLHNLSYHVDTEVPNKYSQLGMSRSTINTKDKSSTGCFSQKSTKIQDNDFDLPVPEEDNNPKGANLLFHSDMIHTYLSLLRNSKNDSTLEACAGALQNLTASKGMMSNATSQIIGLKENGLPQISRLLQSGNTDVQKTATSLLCNMSRHKPLHQVIASQALPTLSQLFSGAPKSSKGSDDILSSACYTMRNLMVSNPLIAKQNLNSGILTGLMAMCKNGYSPKASLAASTLLSDLWGMKEIQGLLKQQGINKNLMNQVAPLATRAFQKSF
ncbi:plakophilin-1 [Protopterus annectens]|uniref:plakophilin-1 n=1 Tax=Protopterus annectens TaxID=7888 RepID=UPI001CFC3FC6|nr:plakophilin-1 [Protopterus annectens]